MDDLPRDIAGRGGSEEHGQPLDIFREAHPVHGGLPGESLDDFRLVEERGGELRLEEARRDGIGRDARSGPRPCFGHAPRELGYSAL